MSRSRVEWRTRAFAKPPYGDACICFFPLSGGVVTWGAIRTLLVMSGRGRSPLRLSPRLTAERKMGTVKTIRVGQHRPFRGNHAIQADRRAWKRLDA